MNRVLKRPMFRIGGSAGTGITSGLDVPRKQYSEGSEDPLDRTQIFKSAADITKQTMNSDVRNLLLPKQRGIAPGTLGGFLTSFGLNLASATPTGNIFSTAAKAAQTPFQTFQAARLARADDKADLAKDIFTGAVASEYDLAVQELKNKAAAAGEGVDLKTAEIERNIIVNAQEEIFKQREILENPDSTAEEKKLAEQTIKIQQNVLTKELGVPPEYAAIISSAELFDAEMTTVVNSYNEAQDQKRKEYLENNPGTSPEEVLTMFPDIVDGSAQARAMTFEDLKKRFGYAKGGRAGYKMGSEPMMEDVVESKKQTGEVKELSFTELRARLPQEISNDIVQLLAQSKQALVDFANIQTAEDIASFNQQYNVNLTLPQGA